MPRGPLERMLLQPPQSRSSNPLRRGQSLLNRQALRRARASWPVVATSWLGRPQRMLTNVAHIAASPAPTKT